ncbi:uncharacterized protein LOC120260040 [Dioscorea cayenensis subsp. rotundata]|uniref:Uncharacterized protein LOC120260040 n=1 Tax=Dioscorea cayennensis subsp. rotundata TaxID=55577 RepID=A0AB40B8W0_DIOCR|nr:uncharacterized protein LOC120260040 [Dioscorea cayenensis subsp. rotundata]
MKDKDSDEWPDAVKVWKLSRQRPNGTWVVPNGEEIMDKLQKEGEKNREKISSAPLPLVEHFGLVLERKSSYSRGLGLKGITSTFQQNSQILVEAEAAKKRANDLDDEVARLNEITKNQEEKIQAQHVAIEKQAMEMKQVSTIFAHLGDSGLIPSILLNPSTPIGHPSTSPTSSAPTSHVTIKFYKMLNRIKCIGSASSWRVV